jgi:hypothetical protein
MLKDKWQTRKNAGNLNKDLIHKGQVNKRNNKKWTNDTRNSQKCI